MHKVKRTVSVLLVMLLLFMQGVMFSFAADDDPSDPPTDPTPITISADTHRLHKKATLQLRADTDKPLIWSSSDTKVVDVDQTGLVTGKEIGHAHITAEDAESGTQAQFTVYVVRKSMPWRKLLEKMSILGYRYSFEDDFYYTDDIDCWQKYFGFNFAYDSIAPLLLFEYDYTRVFFTYGGKDWMIQMWKGQYGAVFYGSEVGVYTKPEGKKTATRLAHYGAASEEDFLKIGSALYRKNYSTGEYAQEFEVPYADHWWATGFVPGHLWDTTPCSELRTVTHITLKDAEMAKLFADGLGECGFREVRAQDKVTPDTYFRDGADVYLQWQNLSEAANSHVVQATFWSIVGLNGLLLGLFLLGFLMLFGGLGFLIFLI